MEKKRNLWVISTDKPSRLYLGNNGNFVFGMIQTSIQSRNEDFTNQNIYITSYDEEIKEGDWIKWGEAIYKANKKYIPPFKKIILTTDQDLIANGVQSIPDDFLECFVKNPNCESVEVEYGDDGNGYQVIIPKEEALYDYGWCKGNVIFPKEEPKQECIATKNMHLDSEIAYKSLPKKESVVNGKCFKCGNSEYNMRRPFCTDDFCNKDFYQKAKQETLEQVAEKEYPDGCDGTNTSAEIYRRIFIDGAKWQQERSYSEEEVEDLIYRVCGTVARLQGIMLNSNHIDTAYNQFKKK